MVIMQTGFNAAGLRETSSVKDNVKISDGSKSKFESFMNQTSGDSTDKVSDSQKTIKKMFAGKENADSVNNGNMNTGVTDNEPEMNVYEEAAVELVKQIVQAVQETTGCTEEQAEQFVAGLEEPVKALTDGSAVKEIVMMANNITEPSELIVNKDACSQMQELSTEIKNLISEFAEGKTLNAGEENAIDTAVKDITMMADVLPDVPVEENAVIEADVPKNQVQSNQYEDAQLNAEDNSEEVSQDNTVVQDRTVDVDDENGVTESIVNEKAVSDKETVDNVSENDDAAYENNTTVKRTVADENSQTGSGQSSMESQERHAGDKTKTGHVSQLKEGNVTSGGVVNNLFQTIKETVSTAIAGEPQQTSFATRILNQVLDGIKVMTSENMSSMEMQLNPESLGKLSIQVISKNGVVTAQIAAQSEAVKEAVESQIAVLRQNMEEHGLKIEDVEVTVASHGFEQDMNNGNGSSHENQQEHRHADSSHSTVNADIKAVKEEVAEEIIKEQKGSTVSYSA